MAAIPYVTKRGTVFWFKRKVPADLRGHYAPRTHITFTLNTRDRSEAARKARAEAVRLDEEFERVRRQPTEPAQTELSPAAIRHLVDHHVHALMVADEEARRDGLGARESYSAVQQQVLKAGGWARFRDDGPPPPTGMNEREFHTTGESLTFVLEELRPALARGDTSVIDHEVEDLLEAHSIKLAPGSDGWRKLAYALLQAEVRAYADLQSRQEGRPVDTPPEPPPVLHEPVPVVTGPPEHPPALPARPDGEVVLSALWDRYVRERKPPEKTRSEFGTAVRRFTEINGDLPLRTITRAHVRAYKDALLQYPARPNRTLRALTVPQVIERLASETVQRLTLSTINTKGLGAISAVFAYAVQDGLMDTNPAQGIKAIGDKRDSGGPKRLPFSIEDLRTIFGSPVFTEGVRPNGGGGEAAKWLPLLGLFTGARLEEIGALDTADVRRERDAWIVHIHDVGEGRSVKTRSSRRKVPVHPELIRLGFLDYVNGRHGATDPKLFPAVKSSRSQRTSAFSQWFGRYLDSIGIADRRKTFHSFRHAVKRALRAAGVEPALRDALQGHAAKDVAERYGLDEDGSGFALPVLADAMSKLAYPGLDLSHLYPSRPGGT